ncbi:MAG: peptidylprolyl isomerase [Bacteroidales bacterium]|nr:peptidylprolyl isomerase [Bacteroidales bacterium]
MKRYLKLLLVFVSIPFAIVSGQGDEILLTIGDEKVSREEFERIYRKNNTSTVYDNKSVEEYLQLFINFKLKVIEAENLGYDTLLSFINELAGYREQLAKPYLEDKGSQNRLLEEAYYRSVNEVSASHILLRIEPDAAPSDTLLSYNQMIGIRNRILKGEPFDKVAREESEDPSAQKNGGHLGWFSAFQMIYPFETAAYTTKIGEVSMPFRTRFGYHILKVENKRPSPGKVRLAHIMVLGNEQDTAARKEGEKKVFECYEKLKKGEDFVKLAAEYSDDRNTASKGGDLNWIRSGVIPEHLEKVVFSLKDSGDFSEPQSTDYGWHIFRLLGKAPIESFEELKPELERKLSRDNRNTVNEKLLVERIKKENNFTLYEENLQPVKEMLDESVYSGKWDPSVAKDLTDPVISFTNKDYTQYDLAKHIAAEKSYKSGYTFDDIVNTRLEDFIHVKSIDYEKSQLEFKYPEFKHLMEEYHDGILLFNLTDELVWSKAMKDTAGLEQFHENNKNKYMWQERISLSTYTFEDSLLTKKVLKLAKKRIKQPTTPQQVQDIICKNDTVICINVEDKKLEKDDMKDLADVSWQKGFIVTKKDNNKFKVLAVNDIIQPEPKQLSEARGLITADYQTYLEQEWIKSLREKYTIEVNQEVLKKIVQ